MKLVSDQHLRQETSGADLDALPLQAVTEAHSTERACL